jgi:hypothetical protein
MPSSYANERDAKPFDWVRPGIPNAQSKYTRINGSQRYSTREAAAVAALPSLLPPQYAANFFQSLDESLGFENWLTVAAALRRAINLSWPGSVKPPSNPHFQVHAGSMSISRYCYKKIFVRFLNLAAFKMKRQTRPTLKTVQ